MSLIVTHPIVSLDLETTGTSTRVDRVVQIGLVKVYPDGRESEWKTYVNPTIAIPPEATDIHHITDEMVKDAPTFRDLAPALARGFAGCDFAGYNVGFDLRFLRAEFARVSATYHASAGGDFLNGRIVDGLRLFQHLEPRTLSAAAKWYCGDDADPNLHDAGVDARTALKVIRAQLTVHPELPRDVESLHRLLFETARPGRLDPEGKIYWRYREATIGFGKHEGDPLRRVPKDYLRWVLNADYSVEVKRIVRDALEGKYPKWEMKP